MTANAATRIDFYVLNSSNDTGRLNFVCRLAEKAYGKLNAIYALADSETTAHNLDEMLWTFRQGSFVPHEILSAAEPRAPVRIATPGQDPGSGELLINISGQAPAFVKKFGRIAEIIDAEPARRAAGRQLFRHYREMGLEPVTHNI